MANQLTLSEIAVEFDDETPPESTPVRGRCRICTTDDVPGFPTDDVFSNAFTDAPLLRGGDCICWRCNYLAEATDYRRYHWIATASEGIQVTKDRETLLETLLDPPEESWIIHIVSDFLNILNGWIVAQRLNTSRQRYAVVYDTERINLDRDTIAAMTAFGRELRSRDVAKGVMRDGPSAGDLEYYDLEFEDVEQIEEYCNQPAWELVVTLIQ